MVTGPFGILPIIPQSIGWIYLATMMGAVAALWIYSALRLRIFIVFMISTTMVPLVLVATFLHRFILPEPPLTDAIAFQYCFFGAVIGIIALFMAELLYALEVLRKEKRQARGRLRLGRKA